MNKLTITEIAEMMEARILYEGDKELSEFAIDSYSFHSGEGTATTLFLPTVGERVDAHDFIADARKHGMQATVTERGRVEAAAEDMVYLCVSNTRDALQKLGAAYRERYAGVPVVGITGSVGKTTTKEMVAACLETVGVVLKTEGNKNGQLGVPLMMLMLDSTKRVAVIEMGMSLFGEMARIAPVAKPNYCVITNIGVSHIGNLHSQENIRKEKLCILNEIRKPAIVFVNGDDERLAALCPNAPHFQGYDSIAMYDETRKRLADVTFRSYGQSEWCDYRAVNVVPDGDGASFDYVHEGTYERIVLNVPGNHNISNAIAAMAVAEAEGIAPFVAKRGLYDYRPIAMRGNVEWLDSGICLVDDTYNASPDSMKSGLDILEGQKGSGRKIAVLADILELGEKSEECHRLVGTYVKEHSVDILFTIGAQASFIAEEARTKAGLAVKSFATREEALEPLLSLLASGDMLLLKGSRGMGLDLLAGKVREHAIR